jgi:heme exporter protein A
MLAVRDLACLRGDRRLFRRLALELAPGQWLRVLGSNGTGKTSLLRLLAGLGIPDAGEVLWRGQGIRQHREIYARELLYLGHLPALKDDLTPVQNLQFACALAGQPASAAAVAEALGQFGLARQSGLPCRVLSAGQRRRAALARLALAQAQTLWVLDEPFTALDVQAVAMLCQVIEGHLARGGMAVLTSHQEVPLNPALGTQLQVDAWAA